MRFQVYKFLMLITLPLLFLACPSGENGNGGSGFDQVETQDDADSVAMIIEHQADEPIAAYSDTTWNSDRIDGSFSGYAIVSGTYYESRSTYENVSIEFYNYQDQSDYPSLTGSATIDGTLTYSGSYPYGSYDGEWTYSGTVTLDPSVVDEVDEYAYLYEGTVDFTFVYEEKLYYYGTITANGNSWNVDNYY